MGDVDWHVRVDVDRVFLKKFLKNLSRAFSKKLFLCILTDLNSFRYVNAVTWSPDGKSLASAGNDSTVEIWDASTGQCQSTLSGHSGW